MLVVAVFAVLELITNNVVEPLAYGKSAGVSTVALLVSATFWTWVWGPLGLVLSVPLTVVLAVLGKHIPQFEPLGVLLSDEPALAPYVSFYQRLLAGDVDEAASLLEEQLGGADRVAIYDQFVVPALAMAERDRYQGILEETDQQFVWRTTRDLIDENAPEPPAEGERRIYVLGCPAQDLADELALTMLSHVIPPQCELVPTSSALLVAEVLSSLAARPPDAVCISALGPGGASHVRYLVKRIRQEHPQLRILVGRWGYNGDEERMVKTLKSRGATHVVTTLSEASDYIERLQPVRLLSA
jgi:hypothetical protein